MSDREVLQAFEETITRNVQAAVSHSNGTRDLIRQLESKVELLEGQIKQYEERFALIQTQLANMQARVYSGGTA